MRCCFLVFLSLCVLSFLSYLETVFAPFVVVFCLLLLLLLLFYLSPFSSRKLGYTVLKKIGCVGGNEGQVRSRIRYILSKIDSRVTVDVAEVRALGSSSLPPIYEVRLEDSVSAVALRQAFSRFSREKNPVKCPPELEGVGVYNCVSLATRVRISILRVRISFFLVFGSV